MNNLSGKLYSAGVTSTLLASVMTFQSLSSSPPSEEDIAFCTQKNDDIQTAFNVLGIKTRLTSRDPNIGYIVLDTQYTELANGLSCAADKHVLEPVGDHVYLAGNFNHRTMCENGWSGIYSALSITGVEDALKNLEGDGEYTVTARYHGDKTCSTHLYVTPEI